MSDGADNQAGKQAPVSSARQGVGDPGPVLCAPTGSKGQPLMLRQGACGCEWYTEDGTPVEITVSCKFHMEVSLAIMRFAQAGASA